MGASDFAKLPHIGESVRRKEDYRFLTGAGQYTDDINAAEPGLRRVRALAARACGASSRVDIAARRSHARRDRIFTGKDVDGKMGGLPCGWLINNTDGTPMKEPPHPILAHGKVRYVGDHVAMVVAETLEQARDAAEAVEVDYDVLPAVVERARRRQGRPPRARRRARQPLLQVGASATRRRSTRCSPRRAHVTKLDLVNNRLVPNAIEPRAAIGSYNRAHRRVHALRLQPEPARRAPADDGLRAGPARAQGARDRARRRRRLRLQDLPLRRGRGLTWAAKQLNRSIKWTCDRSEAFLSDAHGRDHVSHAEMAMDKDGKFLALRVHTDANLGAYLSTFSTAVPTILYAHAAGRPVQDAADLRGGRRLVHQHRAGRCLPRRRAARGHLPAGAPGDALRLGDGHRAGRDPQAQLHHRPSPTRRRWRCSTTSATTRRCMDKAQALADVPASRRAARPSEAKGKLRGIGYSQLHRGLRHRAVQHRGRARRARRPVRVRRDPRAPDRQRHGVHRLAQPRPGPRNHLRAGGGGAAGHPGRQRRRGARRHRPRAVRHGHLRLALDLGRRRGHHEGARQDRGQGQEDRGAPDGGERRRRRVRQRRVHRQGHRQEAHLRPGRADRLRAAQLPARQAGARA